MINYNIDFVINKSATIRVYLDTNIKKLRCCENTNIALLKNNKNYLLSSKDLHDQMYFLKNALKKALANQLQLHPSIATDIGYLYNENLQFKPGLIYEQHDNCDCWVGEKYLMWNYNLATWLYNDSHGNMILHITPTHPGPWGNDNFDEKAHELTYAQWIANEYKPFWTTTLSPATALLWLRLAENIFNKVP